MQMYNETRRKTSSVRLFLQRKRLMRMDFGKECIIKKKGIYPRHPIFINLKSNTMKTQCKYTRFMLYNMLFWRISAFY